MLINLQRFCCSIGILNWNITYANNFGDTPSNDNLAFSDSKNSQLHASTGNLGALPGGILHGNTLMQYFTGPYNSNQFQQYGEDKRARQDSISRLIPVQHSWPPFKTGATFSGHGSQSIPAALQVQPREYIYVNIPGNFAFENWLHFIFVQFDTTIPIRSFATLFSISCRYWLAGISIASSDILLE